MLSDTRLCIADVLEDACEYHTFDLQAQKATPSLDHHVKGVDRLELET
jgi:hypothetical protein